MKKNIFKLIKTKSGAVISVAVASAFVSLQSHAAVDAAVLAQLTETGADIAIIGTALISLAATAMTFRWLKATFF